ncbi:hypothetical protein ACFL6C_04890 [Myxococcota bacterium]
MHTPGFTALGSVLFGLLAGASGCSLFVNAAGKECVRGECPGGMTCDEKTGECVRATGDSSVQGDGNVGGDSTTPPPGDNSGSGDTGGDPLGPQLGTPIYYSVGVSVSDLSSGGTLTLSNGTATFSDAQPANVGVGDAITYNATSTAYIAGRISPTQYTVITATGLTPANVSDATVDSIERTFNSLSSAMTNSGRAGYLGTTDLVSGSFQLNWVCYDDGVMDDTVDIDDYTTGADNYIRIYAPKDPSEVGVSQRHTGIAGTGFRLAPTNSVSTSPRFHVIQIRDDHVRLEGLEIDGSNVTNQQDTFGINVDGSVSASADIRYSHNIVHDITNSTVNSSASSRTIGMECSEGRCRVSNNIVYDITNVASNPTVRTRGISVSDGPSYVFNNTVFDIKNMVSTGTVAGIQVPAGPAIIRNNIVVDLGSTAGSPSCFPGSMTQSNNVSSDGTAAGAGSRTNMTDHTSYFVNTNEGAEDLHLQSDSNTLWGSNGMPLHHDPDLPILDDIDGDPRDPIQPEIGADE